MTTRHSLQRHSPEAPIIPTLRSGVTGLRAHAFLAVMTGFALRFLFVFQVEAITDDSKMYLQLARNWADHLVYGIWLNGHLIPTDLRMPGYPAFVAGISMIIGRSIRAISLSQIVIDLCTCYLTAALAAMLAPSLARRVVWIAALWLAVTCPFIANYSVIVLTETLVTFLTTAALVFFVLGLRHMPVEAGSPVQDHHVPPQVFAMLGALVTGFATLVRPEMPLLLAAAGLIYVCRWWKVLTFRKLTLAGMAMAGAFLLPLLPWAGRNFVTLREVQILTPRYTTLPGEYAPVGYYAWTATWLERYRDVYSTIWRIGEEPQEIEDLPPTAFDSPEEKTQIAALFQQYNMSESFDLSPQMDHEFAEIARRRTKRHPFRTYIQVPFERTLTIWFTPRTAMLPIDGNIWPIREQWENSRADVLFTIGFTALGYLYVALAGYGIWVAWGARRTSTNVSGSIDGANFWGIALLLVYLLVRTTFLTTVEAPEPRYVVSCYPAVLALVAQVFARNKITG